MAKKSKNSKKISAFDAIDEQKAIGEEHDILVKISKEYEKLLDRKKKGKPIDNDRLNTIRKEHGSLNAIEKKISDLADKFNAYSKEVEDFKNELDSSVNSSSELDDALASIGNIVGKTSAIYEQHAERVDKIKAVSSSISRVLQNNVDLNTEDRKKIEEVVDAYKTQEVRIAEIQKEYARGNVTKEEAARMVQQEADSFEDVASKIDKSSKAGRVFSNVLAKMNKENKSFLDSAQKTQKAFEGLDSAMSNFSGLPAMQELNTLIKTNKNNAVELRAAMMALGAAIGAAAYDYFGAELKAQREIKLKAKIDNLEIEQELIDNSIKTGLDLTNFNIEDLKLGGVQIEGIDKIKRGNIFGPDYLAKPPTKEDIKQKKPLPTKESVGRRDFLIKTIGEKKYTNFENQFGINKGGIRDFLNEEIGLQVLDIEGKFATDTLPKLEQELRYATQKAAISFAETFDQGAAQFRAAAKTAVYGGQLGKTGFNIGQLQLAGIDPSQISEAMSQLAAITGKITTAKLGAEMALIAKRTGQSTESIASLTEYFQRMSDLSAESAVNLVEGMRAMAKASNLDLGNLMSGVAEASKDALSYQIRSGQELAKQVAASQSIGVNFSKLAAAGKSMVLNYKDSIKAEMSLSAMLGRSVNLSEVRAKAMSGDYQGMMQALKAQGLNPAQMNMFEQEQLTQAIGGLDLDSIQRIYRGEVKTPADLRAGNAAAGGQDFLSRTKAAQATLAAESAVISATYAIISAKLENQMATEFITQFGPGIEQFNAMMDSLRKRYDLMIEQAAQSTKANQVTIAEKDKRTQESSYGGMLEKGGFMLLGSLLTLPAALAQEALKRRVFKPVVPPPAVPPATVPPATVPPGGAPPPGGGPAPKGGFLKSAFKSGKGKAAIAALVVGAGYYAYQKFFGNNDKKEKQQENEAAFAPQVPEIKTQPSVDEIRQQILQTQATNDVASGVQQSNDLLNGVIKSNNLSGICSCIASNMQEQMGMMVTELQNFKAANENAVKISAATADTINYKDQLMHGGKAVGLHAGAHFVPTLTQKGYKSIKQKLGSKTVQETTEKLATREVTEKVALKGVSKLATSVGKLANPAGWIGLGAEIGGGFLEELGKSKQSTAMYETGRATETVGATLSYGAIGAMLGSWVGPIGTVVGAAVGGGYGLISSLMSNYFSEEAQKEAAYVKQAEEQKKKADALNAQIGLLIAIQQPGIDSAQKTMEDTNRMLALASDEKVWRGSMLAQTLESTRLLSIIASGYLKEGSNGQFTDKLGNAVKVGNYDKTLGFQAQTGVLKWDDDKQKDVAKIIGQYNSLAKQGKTNLTINGESLDLQGYMKKYNVSKQDVALATERAELMKINQQSVNQKIIQDNGKTVNNANAKNTATVNNTKATTNAGGNTNTVTDASSLASLLTVMQTIQQNDNQRGIIIYGYLKDVISAYLGRIEMRMTAPIDLMNTTLATISANMALIRSYLETKGTQEAPSVQTNAILQKIQMEADLRGITIYAKQKDQDGNLQKIVTKTENTKLATDAVTKNIKVLNNSSIPSFQNIEDIQIEMVKILQENRDLLAAMAVKEQAITPIVNLDGKKISDNISGRMQNKQAFNKSGRLSYKVG